MKFFMGRVQFGLFQYMGLDEVILAYSGIKFDIILNSVVILGDFGFVQA